MSVNVYQPHVLVLPEDDANRQMANGFVLHAHLKQRNIQILPPSGGWGKVLASFVNDHIAGLRKYPHRHLVLLIDFDDHVDERREHFVAQFPPDVRERVFLLGTSSEPEPLKKSHGNSLEAIGKQLATECERDETELWAHRLLAHNAAERQRLNAKVKAILF
jgi:hypothetical protein